MVTSFNLMPIMIASTGLRQRQPAMVAGTPIRLDPARERRPDSGVPRRLLLLLPLALMAACNGRGSSRDEGVTIDLDKSRGRPASPLPPVYGSKDAGRPLVVLDAGHGGRDPGAISPFGGRQEKDVTLAVARAIRDELAGSGRVRVAMTREDDRFLVLRDRYEIARRMGAQLFVSIHADAAPAGDSARGATIYTLSEVASDREAAQLAVAQNGADALAGAPPGAGAEVNRILIDLAQRESMEISADFANLLKREASAYFPFRSDYHRFASLVVLKAPDVPSILFETGYLTNPADAAYIESAEGRRQIAAGMRSAIETHFARRRYGVASAH
jgi:N-acetylmuramoyl-L-alanine amidase